MPSWFYISMGCRQKINKPHKYRYEGGLKKSYLFIKFVYLFYMFKLQSPQSTHHLMQCTYYTEYTNSVFELVGFDDF